MLVMEMINIIYLWHHLYPIFTIDSNRFPSPSSTIFECGMAFWVAAFVLSHSVTNIWLECASHSITEPHHFRLHQTNHSNVNLKRHQHQTPPPASLTATTIGKNTAPLPKMTRVKKKHTECVAFRLIFAIHINIHLDSHVLSLCHTVVDG